ncbi:MAG: diaminopimelate epimerase, partial [Lachnospiraceae bacterium]|nr:diaminopimelate epimerase [Lachnospiraceae bacterium]
MKFTKMQGAGNDYVYINGFTEHVEDKVTFVKWISDRHFGVGSDGAIFINPSETADFEMEMYNADGSRSEMCGNGIRCVGKYVYDHGLTDKKEITVESFGRIKYLTLYPGRDGRIESVRVNMGAPVLKGSEIPVRIDKDTVIGEPITVNGTEYRMTCVSMGNPHAVVFIDDTDNLDIESVGPVFENHELFPNRINTEFVQVVDKSHVKMRVWERGTGETLACGTGCCATTVACILNGLTDEEVTVKVLGGEIIVKWDR